MNPVARLFKTNGTLQLSGTRIPKFEHSVLHAGARDAVRIINEVHAIEDEDGALMTEFLATSEGAALLDSLDSYLLHALTKRRRRKPLVEIKT